MFLNMNTKTSFLSDYQLLTSNNLDQNAFQSMDLKGFLSHRHKVVYQKYRFLGMRRNELCLNFESTNLRSA